MGHFYTLTLLALFSALASAAVHPEATLPFLEYCKYFKYPAEAHQVIT